VFCGAIIDDCLTLDGTAGAGNRSVLEVYYRRSSAMRAQSKDPYRIEEYRRRAEECQRQAKNAVREDEREAWLTLAESWLQLLKPALAEQLARPPKGEGWIHEVKFDGYRIQIHIANEAIKILTRRGHDWTSRFKKIALDAWRINARSAIIDGEVVAPAADGVSDFSVLQKEIRAKRSDKLVMYGFDLLYLNGNDLRSVPLKDRKARLRDLICNTDILFSESFDADGATIFARACEMGVEGIVSKRAASRYRSERAVDAEPLLLNAIG
jgi:ATP-dependent DNA ligase